MPRGSITDEQIDFVETWQNVSAVQNYIVRLDPRNQEVYELVTGDKHFKISTHERIITEDKIVDPANNPFRNGCFRPVIVPPDVTVESNPNALSDQDIMHIFKGSDLAWDEWLKVIDSPATLRRMMDLADEGDITLRRYRELEARNTEVTGGPRRLIQKDQDEYDTLAGAPSNNNRKKRVSLS